VINTLVLPAHYTGWEQVFFPRGRSLMYIINNKSPNTGPWGTPQYENNVMKTDVLAL
jgi:hypothetical protein